jgi:predicted nucleic acid-binding protein
LADPNPKVLDSWALLCYLEKERGTEKVIALFENAARFTAPLFMSVINWGEVYYQVSRRYGETKAEEIERLVESLPITIVDADKELTREAARLKAVKKLAYADCFAAALARWKKGELYTGDPEFKIVEKEVKIVWL